MTSHRLPAPKECSDVKSFPTVQLMSVIVPDCAGQPCSIFATRSHSLSARRLVTSKRKKVQNRSARNAPRAEASRNAAETAFESPLVPHSPIPILSIPILKVVLIAAAVFVAAHLALLIGLTAPDKITSTKFTMC